MNPTFRTIPRTNMPNRHKNCYLCDVRVQSVHIRNVDQLFYEPPKKNQEQSKPLAAVLAEVLEQNIDETSAHSKVVCRKCQQMCSEYDQLTLRLQEIRHNITNTFNETASKYNMKVIEMDFDQNFEVTNQSDDSNIPNMYSIETVAPVIGEVFNNENAVAHDSTKNSQMKKVMLVTPDNGSNPFFTISSLDETIDEDQAMHTVKLNFFSSKFACKNFFFKICCCFSFLNLLLFFFKL